jgi:sugar phosphate isomerase/epimerase
MNFGMPTLLEIKSLSESAALCQELGLDFVELNMNLPQYQANQIDIAAFAKISKHHDIYYTIHLDENFNPCDFNEKVAMAYTETILQTIEIAKQLEISILNMHLHSGVYFTMPDRKVFLFDEYQSEYVRKLSAFRDICTTAIGDSDIKICVENCGDFANPCTQKGLEVLLDSSVFALTFDVGHNAGAGYSDEPIIMKYADRLAHFHIHDALGKSNHLVLGSGDMDLMKYIDLAKSHNCRMVLEVKTVAGLRESLKWLRKNVEADL